MVFLEIKAIESRLYLGQLANLSFWGRDFNIVVCFVAFCLCFNTIMIYLSKKKKKKTLFEYFNSGKDFVP